MNSPETSPQTPYIPLSELSSLLKNPALKISEYRVLAQLLLALDGQSYRAVSVSELAEKLGQDRARVSGALGVLAQEKLIARGAKIGRNYTYRLTL